MSHKRLFPKKRNKHLALSRIEKNFELAEKIIRFDKNLAQRYISIAIQISKASRVHLTKAQKQQICKKCKKYISPGIGARIRVKQKREPHVVVTCTYCGEHKRYLLKPKEYS